MEKCKFVIGEPLAYYASIQHKNNMVIYKKQIFRGITKNILILGLVSLFTDLSSQMIFPLIPLFLTSSLGVGASIVGMIEGAAEATASLFKVASGYWSDKIKKRKPFVLFGYSLSTLIKPLFALANVWIFVLLIRVLERIGKGIRNAPRDAIVAESCDESVRGKAYGFHRAMDGIGSILGAVVAFVFLPILGYRNLFLFAFVPGLIAVLIVFFIKEKESSPQNMGSEKAGQNTSQDTSQKINVNFNKLSLNLKLFIVISSIFALGHFGYAFLLLRAQSIGLTDQTAILLYVLFYVVYVICSIPSGILSDKIGRKPVLIASYLLFIITSIGLIFVSNLWSIILFFAIYGVYFAMIDGSQRAFVVDLAPKHLKATALGTFHAAIGLVALPGGLIAGLLWDKINPTATFLYAITLTIISLLLFVFFVRKDETLYKVN